MLKLVEEKYLKAVYLGKTPWDAYFRLYPNTTNTAKCKKLAKAFHKSIIKRKDAQNYITRLTEAGMDQFLFDKEAMLMHLQGIMFTAERDSDKLKSIEIINKMVGNFAPEKVETTIKTIDIKFV